MEASDDDDDDKGQRSVGSDEHHIEDGVLHIDEYDDQGEDTSASVPLITASVPESVVSAAEGLSSLQTSPVGATGKTLAKRKRKEGTPVKGRHAARRKTRREHATITVKDHRIALDEATGASMYKLARLWMDGEAHTLNHPDFATSAAPNGGLLLPPPEPHNGQSSATPARPPVVVPEDFWDLISDAGDGSTSNDQIKENYITYAKALRNWWSVQRAHRLKRYSDRWKKLVMPAIALRPPENPST